MKTIAKLLLICSLLPFLACSQVWARQATDTPLTRITCYIQINERTKSDVVTDFSQFNYLDIAFTNPSDTGFFFPPAIQALIKNAHHHHIKVLATIGGADQTGGIAKLIKDNNRAKFIQDIKAFLLRHCFDGVDIDFETKRLVNKDFEPFIRALHSVLDTGKVKELTLAVGSNRFMTDGYGANKFHLHSDFWTCVDFVNTMSYDSTGTAHRPYQDASSNFAAIDLTAWINVMGVPRDKLGLGLPFYGQQFHKWNNEVGYSTIVANDQLLADTDYAALPDGRSYYYNGLKTIIKKTKQAYAAGVKGIMIWQVTEDVQGKNSLLAAITQAIKAYRENK